MLNFRAFQVILLAFLPAFSWAWMTTTTSTSSSITSPRVVSSSRLPAATSSWFVAEETETPLSTSQAKAQLLQLGASLDRGQAYNPTSGDYYKDRMDAAVSSIQTFLRNHPDNIPRSMEEMQGEWELVLSTVPHGIFRSSPFFLAVQEAFSYAAEPTAFGQDKAELFFKLHELQTCSWGVSKVGRVAQYITKDYLYSEFDTSIFSLTVIPILGWFKLLPTFGGCVITAAQAELQGEEGLLAMKVDYTTSRPVEGLSGLGEWIWKVKVPVGAIWKLLPWNKGRDADCKVYVRYVDDDFRIVEDVSGDFFVYTRPVVPRRLDLVEEESS